MVNIGTPLSDLCILYVQEPVMFTLHDAVFKCEKKNGLVISNATFVLHIWQPASCTATKMNESAF